MQVNPLIVWLWIGGGVMALGTILALSPRLRRRPRSTADDLAPAPDEPRAAESTALEEVPV